MVRCGLSGSGDGPGSGLGQSQRAGHHRDVLRLRVPVLRAGLGTLEQLKGTYGAAKIRIVWKNAPLPFHKNAKPAAEAAMGVFALAGRDAFWRFLASAFRHQPLLDENGYVAWALEAGVRDEGRFRLGLSSHLWATKVDFDSALARKVGADGTPHFFVNGVVISGAQPIDQFTQVIDAELVKAQAAIAKGTPADRVYVEMSRLNVASAPPPEKPGPSEDEERGPARPGRPCADQRIRCRARYHRRVRRLSVSIHQARGGCSEARA